MASEEHLAILRQGVEAWNKWRRENPDVRPDLRKVNFLKQDLSGGDFSEVDLSGSDLVGTNLYQTQFHESKLYRANLSLSNSHQAIFSGANLSETSLIGTNLSGANLYQVNLRGAICGLTQFTNLDLSTVKGLDRIRYSGPSTVGIDTLYKSGGNIPEVFLQGCGVPDEILDLALVLRGRVIDYYSVFISYSSADETFAKMLFDTLQGAGIRCWYAPEQILPGERIDTAIDRGIRYWDKVVFCASKSSLTEKWWVDFEVDKAFTKEQDLQCKRGEKVGVLIPLNLDGYLFSEEHKSSPKRSVFNMTNAADFVGWEHDVAKFQREAQRVVRALQTDGGLEDPPESKI